MPHVLLDNKQIAEILKHVDQLPSDLVEHLLEQSERSDRHKGIVAMAQDKYAREGELEIDDDALVSEGGDNGAYVQAWRWVEFDGTPLDKRGAKVDS